MSAAPAHDDHGQSTRPGTGHDERVAPHPMQRTPAEVRAGLLPEDRPAFDAEWSHALDVARERLDLTELDDVLERWRRLAWLVNGDPDGFRDRMARAEAIQTAAAAGEPWESIKSRFGLVPAPTADEISARRRG